METAISQPAAKMTVSQIMAAKKEAKEAAEVKRFAKEQIGNHIADRNTLSTIRFNQTQTRLKMRDGEPMSKDEQLTDIIKNLMHYQVLIYGYEVMSVTVFEKLIRAMRVISCIYADQELSRTTNAAEAAIRQLQEKEADDKSPNQRREILKPLLKLIDYSTAYSEIIPSKTVDKVALFCASVQIALYTAHLYSRPKRYVQALFDIAQGATLREKAKELKEKENILREEILNAAWDFFRVVECNRKASPVEAIPELRRPEFKELADAEKFADFVRGAMARVMIPFEQNTGISLIDYNKFRKDLIKAELLD